MDDDLQVRECSRCPALCESRSRIVSGVGPTDAELVFVGEAPGAQEDEEGEPFVGRSGDVLTDALRDRGFSRRDVRITNCVRCRPPDNRDPNVQEQANCRGHLDAELDAMDPTVIVTLGKVPSELLLDRDVAVTKEAGSLYDARIAGVARPILVSVHPAATLYDPSQRETFGSALDEAIALVDDSEYGQSRLGDY